MLLLQDEVIQRFEDRCTEANAEIQQLQAAMQESTKRLETADSRLASTMESRNKLRKQLEVKSSENTSSQASLQAENEVLKVQMLGLLFCSVLMSHRAFLQAGRKQCAHSECAALNTHEYQYKSNVQARRCR